MDVIDDANALMPEVFRIVVELEVVLRPNSAAFETDRCNFGADHGISRQERRIRPLGQFEAARFRDGEYYVALVHVFNTVRRIDRTGGILGDTGHPLMIFVSLLSTVLTMALKARLRVLKSHCLGRHPA